MDGLSEQVKTSIADEVFAGGGEMGALMRSLNWSTTPLGLVENWPQSLRTAVSICLASHFPMLIWWGPELVKLYNDAYRPILGATKHPGAMGQRGRECWPEIWDIIGPMLEGVLQEGKATWSENQLLLLERNGYPEECYFTFSYSPIRDESGGIGGIFTAVTETTQQVLSERRLLTLRELATSTYEAQTAEDACRIAAEVLAKNTADIPFALLYLLDSHGKQAHLVGSSGVADGTAVSPSLVDLSLSEEPERTWPLAQVVRTGQAALVTNASILPISEDAIENAGSIFRLPRLPDNQTDFVLHFASGSQEGMINRDPTRQSALVLPVTRPGQKEPYGLLIAGVSPLLQLDDNYRGFFTLVASQVAATIANVRAYEENARLYQSAQDAIRLRDELFSIVSHDLKNPVATVKGFAQLLKRMVNRSNLPDKAQQEQLVDGLSRIDLTATRMTTLINELLDIAHLQIGKPLNLDLRETDLVRLVHQAIISYQQTTERHKFHIEIGEPELVGWWDAARMERVFGNLLSNAIKYSPDGGIITVRVIKEDGEWAVLSVEDQGVGIPADDLPHIFDRFHRVANVAGQIKGSGIGLASAHNIIKQHGGSITVTSQEGKGSTFTVRLPLKMPDEDANA